MVNMYKQDVKHEHTEHMKFTLEQATKAQRGSRCIVLLFLKPQHQMVVGGKCHASATLPLGKTWYPLYRRPGGLQGQSGWFWKILSPVGFDPWTVQPLASRYID